MKHFYHRKTLIACSIIFVCIFYTSGLLEAYPALITVPIADLVGSPLPSNKKSTLYEQLPLCGVRTPFSACPRLHQALFNQYVEVVQESGDQVCINIPNVFYITEQSKKPHNQFWTTACAITPLSTLEKQGIKRSTFPNPITAATTTVPHAQIITLIEPWHDTTTGLTFSAGTRFVDAKKTDANFLSVYRYDPTRNTVSIMRVPKKQCFVDSAQITPDERIRSFVALARTWAHKTDGAIPYVWGGCSYIQRSQPTVFTEITLQPDVSAYARPDCIQSPQSGLDCSGFICLAAQCCGIPYFLKNSTTVVNTLRPVAAQEAIIEGDIIWIPKHVMIIGSLKHNTLIEARHYAQGYGYVHEVPLATVFKNIKTYQDLHQACINKKPLIRLDSNGNEYETIRECKILHIMSVWD